MKCTKLIKWNIYIRNYVCYVMNTCRRLIFHLLLYNIKKKTNKAEIEVPLGLRPETNKNQSTVITAKRLASLFWYLIASTIVTLHNTINGYEIACIFNSKYNVHVCMYDPNKCWFYISKTYCFCFLLTLNCENLA